MSQSIKFTKNGRIQNAAVPAIRLNPICAQAARLAFAVAPIVAKSAVAVVPTLAPIIAEAASVRGSQALFASVKIIAMTAADDCIITVRINPISANDRIEIKPFPVN